MNNDQLSQSAGIAEEEDGGSLNGNGSPNGAAGGTPALEAEVSPVVEAEAAPVAGNEAAQVEPVIAPEAIAEHEEEAGQAAVAVPSAESEAALTEPVVAPEAVEGPESASLADQAAAGVARAERSAEGGEEAEARQEEAAPEELQVRQARDPRLDQVAANASMEDLLRASEQQYRTLKHGDVIEGSVMQVGRDEILVDIGAKTEGIIPSREFQSLNEEERQAMQVGDGVLVSVVQPENSEGHAVLSLDRARQERSWRDLQKKYEGSEVIQAQVIGHNKGGLLVNLEGVRGFVPSSQVSSIPAGEANKQAELAKYHNQVLPLKIIEINRNRNRLILSERQALQEQRETMRSRLLQELEPGQLRPGTVTSICDFGAFVDIGGADGLIHLSELSWKRVSHPSEVLKTGDRINVYVLSVDPAERKIALSLKRTQPEPWSTITDHYQLGQLVKGTITQLTNFGAFARLEDGIEGLIHISELAEGRVAHPRNVVKEGEVVDLKVIRIDPARKRIGLSLKRAQEDLGLVSPSEPSESAEGVERPYEEDRTPEYRPEPVAQARPAPVREPRPEPERPARQERRDRPPREREGARPEPAQRTGRQERRADESEEPMGALAQALAAHARNTGMSLAGEPTEPRQRREPAAEAAEETPVASVSETEVPESATGAVEAESTVQPEASANVAAEPEPAAETAVAPELDAAASIPEVPEEAQLPTEETAGEVRTEPKTAEAELKTPEAEPEPETPAAELETSSTGSETGTDAEEPPAAGASEGKE